MIINLSDFLDNSSVKNSTAAFNAAAESLHDGDTLKLGGGKFDLYPDGAYIKHYYISNNDAGKKSIALPLIGKRDITIDGEGAELICHGELLPIVIDGCESVTLKNLTLDYAYPFYAQAEIIGSDRYHTVVRFDNEQFFCNVEPEGRLRFSSPDGWENITDSILALEFSMSERYKMPIPSADKPPYFIYTGKETDHGFLSSMYKNIQPEQLDANTIKLHGNLGFMHTEGSYLVMTHATRECPGILVTDSRQISLSDLTLYHTASMGIVCQLSEDISLNKIIACARKGSGRLLSCGADATHFVCCRGKITMQGCKFTSMMDDGCNIHGIYMKCRARESERVVTASFGHAQQRGICFCRPGDRVAMIDADRTETVAVRTVTAASLVSPDELRVEFDEPIPDIGNNYLLENRSTSPEVRITGCECGINRPRGFLLSSAGRTVVENCKFYNMNQGIQLGGEMHDWYESGPVDDVLIRGCDFNDSAYAGGAAIYIKPSLYEKTPENFFNGRVEINGCRFVQSTQRFLIADLIKEIIFRNATYICDSSLPYHPKLGDNGTVVTNCGIIEVTDAKLL